MTAIAKRKGKVVPISSAKPAGWKDIKAQPMLVTPAMAEKWLKHAHLNRRLSEARIMSMATDIIRGDWRVNPQPISVNCDGTLIDGYHRCCAIVLADKPIWTMVTTGVPRETIRVVDSGRPRSIADGMRMFEGTHRADRVVACVKAIHRMTHGWGSTSPLSEPQVLAAYRDRYQAGIDWITENFMGTPIVGPARISGALAYAHKTNPDKIEEFALYVRDGGPDIPEPAKRLRDTLMRQAEGRGERDSSREGSLRTLRFAHAYLAGTKVERVRAPGADASLAYFAKVYPPETDTFYSEALAKQERPKRWQTVLGIVQMSGKPMSKRAEASKESTPAK